MPRAFRGVAYSAAPCYRCGDVGPLFAWRYPKDITRVHKLCAECWDWLEHEYTHADDAGAYTRLCMQMLRQRSIWQGAT